MTSPARREAAALAAGWKPHPGFSKENRDFTEHHPQLSLRVWCDLEGVHCRAQVYQLDELGRLRSEDIAEASWRPREVTEVAVVDWGQRALAAWLGRQLLVPES